MDFIYTVHSHLLPPASLCCTSIVCGLLSESWYAAVNINDGFGGFIQQMRKNESWYTGGGHVLQRNVIFNQVLESGDHGGC